MQITTQFRETHDRYFHVALNLAGNLAKVQFRYEESPGIFEFFQCELREWPDRPEPQEPDVVVRMILYQLLHATDRSTVCDKDLFSARVENVIIRDLAPG